MPEPLSGPGPVRLDPEILRVGLELAMEFGKNWLQPIQTRLATRHPELLRAELDAYEQACQEAMRFGHLHVLECWRRSASEKQAFALWSAEFLERFPWASPPNLRHLFSQGRYYAWKDGLL